VVDGQTFTFEVFGLRQDVFVMVDRQTGSNWTHLEVKAIEGPMTGASLTMLLMPQMTWGTGNSQSRKPSFFPTTLDIPVSTLQYKSPYATAEKTSTGTTVCPQIPW
jgi:hypothetical protein